jgi:hypothetical protein
MNFVEKVKLQSWNNIIMTYRGQVLGQDFFAYIKCSEAGIKLMHSDYENRTSRALQEYGEVIYQAPIKDPNETAQKFLENYIAENGGEVL